jgi:hypothetical protein
VWEAPAVCLDLSALGAGSTGSDLALGLEMTCAGAFLDAKRAQRARMAEAAGITPPKVIRVNDEAWRALPIAGLGEYYQAAFKLSRATGVQHWLVLHRPSDLRAAGDEGTRQQRLAEGLVSDASTIVLYHMKPADVPLATDLFGLSSTEAALLGQLGRGEALWLVGGRSFRVQHVTSDIEWDIVRTDRAMLNADESAIDRQAAEEISDELGELAGAALHPHPPDRAAVASRSCCSPASRCSPAAPRSSGWPATSQACSPGREASASARPTLRACSSSCPATSTTRSGPGPARSAATCRDRRR